ncbi:acyl carrier protein [Massilibacteroides sp.]|uniref:acyl carrier protein n=1 Tax=Massilibacteroides sp. TaxID=2034766 RepID=UPI0026135E82|nr:acyl carrier protein [Massilibacteroides sp.]MDD4515959.1 acyl carrier protein [Massilibacteroides sp.]
MDLLTFTTNFADQFEETEISAFTPNTNYKELEEWSSLIALSIIAMIDEEYDVSIKGDDIRSAETIEDLFTIVKNRK